MAPVKLKDVALGEGRTKVIVPLTGRNLHELVRQAAAIPAGAADILEWRVDYFDAAFDAQGAMRGGEVVAAAREMVLIADGRPILFTFRTAGEGGARAITPSDYTSLYTAVIMAGLVDAVDVELRFDDVAAAAITNAARTAGIPVLASWHDFSATLPAEEITAILTEMKDRGFEIAKVACMPQDAGDVLAVLQGAWKMARANPGYPFLAMAMADVGVLSRLAAPVMGSCATFAMVGEPSAPGQIPADQLRSVLDILEDRL